MAEKKESENANNVIKAKLGEINLDKLTQKKVDLIERNLDEITDGDRLILRKIVQQRALKIYWGTAITGRPHIAYFLPILKLRDFLEAGCEVTVMFADIHGFLDNLKAPISKIESRYTYYKKLITTMLGRSLRNGTGLGGIRFIKGSDFELTPKYTFDVYRMASYTTERDCKRAGADVVKQSENALLSSMLYPNMQALDEEYLGVDAQFGGSDQRKIFMHAKTFLPKLGYKKRIHLMNPMMPGLNSEKMSSSDEMSKIDMLDTKQQISKKIGKCFCEEGNTDTGVLTIFEYILFNYFGSVKVSGVEYSTFEMLKDEFGKKVIHPGDLKSACSYYVNEMVAPVRDVMMEETEMIEAAYGKISRQ
ncbi:putative tyrosine--tRNA ligase [Enterospora canceri]|uniref:Tyrosine--tRNA ligase n=1 Tax=Enterospora canceri TaxID=1081671 RepID=A0A1Y1SA33_9MICR|nr:putative tyrosine--tRNA ligase [Enterospora canceri]